MLYFKMYCVLAGRYSSLKMIFKNWWHVPSKSIKKKSGANYFIARCFKQTD